MANETRKDTVLSSVSETQGLKIFTPQAIRKMVSQIKKTGESPLAFGDVLCSKATIVKRYTNEIFDNARRKRHLEKCQIDLEKVSRLVGNKDALAFLEDPEVWFQDKENLLSEELSDISHIVLDLVYRLIAEHHLYMIADITHEYQRLVDAQNGIVRAIVTTAIPLNDEDKLKIRHNLGNMLGKKVIPEWIVDRDIIAGIIIRVGTKMLDGSIRRKMVLLREAEKGAVSSQCPRK